MKITNNFTIAEFGCKDGTQYPEEWIESRLKPLCKDLEQIRKVAEGALMIISAYRTPKHNKKVGGASKSEHVEGRAVDIACRTLTPRQLYNAILTLIKSGIIKNGGVGIYKSWVHYDHGSATDCNGAPRRWVG